MGCDSKLDKEGSETIKGQGIGRINGVKRTKAHGSNPGPWPFFSFIVVKCT